MDLQLFQDLAPAEREEMLDAQADDVTEENSCSRTPTLRKPSVAKSTLPSRSK